MSEGIGASVTRKEDKKFLTGKGKYTDDINRPGQTHAYFVRSDVAHANIKSIDTKAASSADGVVAVYTGEDVVADVENNAYLYAAYLESTELINEAYTEEAPLRFMGQDVFYQQPLSHD